MNYLMNLLFLYYLGDHHTKPEEIYFLLNLILIVSMLLFLYFFLCISHPDQLILFFILIFTICIRYFEYFVGIQLEISFLWNLGWNRNLFLWFPARTTRILCLEIPFFNRCIRYLKFLETYFLNLCFYYLLIFQSLSQWNDFQLLLHTHPKSLDTFCSSTSFSRTLSLSVVIEKGIIFSEMGI